MKAFNTIRNTGISAVMLNSVVARRHLIVRDAARYVTILSAAPTRTNKVLIIDDALGSGATMNEIAHKIKDKLSPKEIIGYAVVGSYKGFDVLGVV